MSGKTHQLSPLELRKQLLIVESEINRGQLLDEIATLTTDIQALTHRGRTLGLIASSGAVLLAGLTGFSRRNASVTEAKPGWLQHVVQGVGLVTTLWAAFRSSRPDPEGK
jgi:hypothetical protein